MSQTSDKSSIVTLINTFTVAPGNQHRLVDLLIRATEGFVSRAPGFISSTPHRCIDGTKVAMYAQWRSVEDYQAMRQETPALCHSSKRRSPSQSLNRVPTRACGLSCLSAG